MGLTAKECAEKTKIRVLTRAKYTKQNMCSQCGFKGYTEWHHWKYHPDCAIELCSKCHRNDKCSQKKKLIQTYLNAIKEAL